MVRTDSELESGAIGDRFDEITARSAARACSAGGETLREVGVVGEGRRRESVVMRGFAGSRLGA